MPTKPSEFAMKAANMLFIRAGTAYLNNEDWIADKARLIEESFKPLIESHDELLKGLTLLAGKSKIFTNWENSDGESLDEILNKALTFAQAVAKQMEGE
jgi:hypothetical protein